ncbi:hypothetical protein BGZ83_002412 [Gryganskiella cystojenkinii]|nr:hypothetical protein BGZ83_002412 [Gryganskiella cystojenkinii]
MSARAASHSQHQKSSKRQQQQKQQQTSSARPATNPIPSSSSSLKAAGEDRHDRSEPEGYNLDQEQTDRTETIGDDEQDGDQFEFHELEVTLEDFRRTSYEEALAIVREHQHRQGHHQPNASSRAAVIGSTSSTDPSSPIPSFSGEDEIFSLSLPGLTNTNGGVQNGSPKRTKRVLSQLDVNELIQMKISQLESASVKEDDDEKVIAKVMKKMHKELTQIGNGEDDHLGKINFMQRKYLEMLQDMRKQERDHLKLKKKFELLQREKDMIQREKDRLQQSNEALMAEREQLQEAQRASTLETTKADLLCGKLEGLCRQMYSDNRKIKEDVLQRTDHISGSFEKAIVEFKDKVEAEIAEKQRRMDENDTLLHEKFQGFLEQYEVREKHFNSVVRSKDLELELAQAKWEQQRQVAQQEIAKSELLKSQLTAFSKTEAELRKQLNVYVDKFMQVEETLNKSNALFQTFRKEMEAMSKKGNSLEKVNLAIRAKCDTMNRNILEMAEERTNHQKALEEASKRRIKLENLCRTLHAERASLRKDLDRYEARYPDMKSSFPSATVSSTMPTNNVNSDGDTVEDESDCPGEDGHGEKDTNPERTRQGHVLKPSIEQKDGT